MKTIWMAIRFWLVIGLVVFATQASAEDAKPAAPGAGVVQPQPPPDLNLKPVAPPPVPVVQEVPGEDLLTRETRKRQVEYKQQEEIRKKPPPRSEGVRPGEQSGGSYDQQKQVEKQTDSAKQKMFRLKGTSY